MPFTSLSFSHRRAACAVIDSTLPLPLHAAPVTTPPPHYCGRFAPSPTGPLHFGSLVAATGSYLEARRQQGHWLLRIDDLDTPRVVKGASDAILTTLDRYGFEWDGDVVYQHHRRDAYQAALQRLRGIGACYPCGCTRRDLIDNGRGHRIYPGRCRNGLAAGRVARSERVRCKGVVVTFTDRIQGPVCQRLEQFSGDFPVLRPGGLHAYHLAVVVDDAAAAITEVVRGADLLPSTPSQIHLQRLLGLPTPAYCHLPVALGADGDKLSKQTGAPPLDPDRPVAALYNALCHLDQRPPPALQGVSLPRLWEWAHQHWSMPTATRMTGQSHGKQPGQDTDH